MYPYLLASVLLTGAMPNKLFKDLKKSQGKAPVVKKIEPKKGTKPAAAKPEEPAKPAGAAPTTDTPAPEPEEPPLTAPPKPKESQLEITPVAPASQPAVDPETSVKLRGLEERVNELKEKIFRSKARLVLLQEAVLHGTITGARAVLVHKNEMSGSFKLEQVQYFFDGAPIYNKQDAENDPKGSKEIQNDEFEIFNGSIVPGSHEVSVSLVYRGNGYGVFSYLNQYVFKVKNSYVFTAEEGKQTTVKIVGFEKGGLATELKDRPAVRFDVEVTKELRAPKGPPAQPPAK